MVKTELAYKDCLTNEMLHKRFKSQFDLVLHAIRLAGGRVREGQDENDLYMHNIASDVLSEIAECTNQLDSITQKPASCAVDECPTESTTKTKGRKGNCKTRKTAEF